MKSHLQLLIDSRISRPQGALTYFALVRFRQGVGDVSQSYAGPPTDITSPYAPSTDITSPYAPATDITSPYAPPTYPSFQNTGPDVYQQPPFTPNPDPSDQNRYQPPVY